MNQHNEKEMKNITDALDTEQPSMRFSKNVMDTIDGLEVARVSKRYINPWVIRVVTAVLILCVAVSVLYVYMSADTLPDYTASFNNSNFPIQQFIHYIIGINILLLLVLADRWLSQKNRSHLHRNG